MSLKDCAKLIKKLDPDDRATFNDQHRMSTELELMTPEEAMTEAAEATMDWILGARNSLADDIAAQGGYIDKLTLENLVNPQSYTPGPRGGAADIYTMSAEEFDTFLEDVAPAPKQDKPVPKEPQRYRPSGEMTEHEAQQWLAERGGKKIQKEKVKDLKSVARAAGISGYSNLDKAGVIKALQAWHEQRKTEQLPDPLPQVMIKIGEYSHADSALRTMITWYGLSDEGISTPAQLKQMETNVRAIAKHFGGSAVKKMPMYAGGMTEKGIHFNLWDDAVRFYQHYKGETPVRDSAGQGGDTTLPQYAQEYEPKEGEYYEGDAVIPTSEVYEGLEGEIIIVGRDPVDGEPLYTVRFDDPDTGDEFAEVFTPQELRPAPPPKPVSKSAGEALKNAAKHGVRGADEALAGLADLFGGKSKFSSGFTFDEDTYAKAKPHFKKSLEEFVSAGKSLKEFLQFILENFGEGIKPYLRQFHQDVAADKITIRGVNDVQLATPDQAQPGEPRAEPADSVDIEDAGAEAAGVPGETGVGPAEEEAVAPGSIGLPVDSSLDVGKQGDINLLGNTGEFQPATGVTGHQDGRRGTVAGAKGVPTATPGRQQVEAATRQTRDRLKLQPTTDTWVQSDPENIAASLPALFPEQHDDVVFAEQRLFDEGHRGVMFTNGTGTGKTFTGLGLAKRMVMQGKDNILVIVPGEKVASDWIKSGKAVQLDLTKLKNIKDAGRGVVVTTYANFAENNEVVKRDWDLIIPDEAHKLSENMAGHATNALNKLRAVTGHPDGEYFYAASMEAELLDKIAGLESQMKEIQKKAGEAEFQTPDQVIASNERYTRLSNEVDELRVVWRERLEVHRENRKGLWNAKTTKRLDLTATPFAYDKSTDHAEGFLFEYDRSINEQSRGYNAPDARESFMVEHFGYRMRTGKLTAPEAEVDRGLMQREFNQWLKEQGALRGRVLTVDHDYSREFVAIDDLVGKKIDDGYDWITKRAFDKNNPKARGFDLMLSQLRKTFNYHARVRMLEAIKARFAVQRARQHMALGRKVVLFHSRIQGGTMNPFHMFAGAAATSEVAQTDEDAALYTAAAAEFVNERTDLMTLDINTRRPLDLFAEEFGDQLTLYNGTITNKQKRENPDRFNSDGEEIQVIAVQDEGGKEGISLHDATGANQRVLINLGLPVRPTQAIQIEGRIYRVGQMSNAIFEYFNTGTNFERMTFAEKISERASTAENLALGEQARTLKDSFIDAYEDPTFEDPSEAQGIGGKETDRANWAATSEFERAKTHYFGTLKTKGKRDQRAGMDYFATPEPLGVKMVEWSGVKPNESVLEPSAGHGAIARYFPENADATYVEPSSELLSRLALRAPGKHRHMRFEDLDVGGNKYHAIVMNPPFGTGGTTAIEHLRKAMHHLKNGGRIVALIPEGPAADKKFENMFYGKDGELEQLKAAVKKKRKEGGGVATETRRIDDLTNFHLRANISLPAITFKRAGTGVRSRIVVIDKITNPQASVVNQSPRDIFADTINELFDKIEGMTVPVRTELEQTPEEYLASEGLTVTYNQADENWLITGRTFDHKAVIRRALGDDVEFARGWRSKIDPVDALYQEMTAPQVEREAQTQPTQADIIAAAAAIISGRTAPDALGGLVVTETKTKTDKQVWEVSGNTREHKDMLKRLGARWYGPKKVWTFWDNDPTDAIAAELRKPLALRDRRGGSTKARVRQYLAAPLKRLSSRVPIEIVQSVDQIKTTFDLPADARGFYIDGKAHIVADNIRDKRDAEIALTHEVVGHLGLEGVLGRRKTNELVGDIVNMKVEEMLAPGTHPRLAQILRTLREVYVDEAGNYTLNPKDEALEVIAHIAESKPRIGPLIEIYNKVMLWFRQQLVRWGFGDPTMLKIEDALVRSVDFVKTPPSYYTGEGTDGYAAMQVYRISDGEPVAVEQPVEERVAGQVNFGFGHYFGSLQEASAFFAADAAVGAPTPQELIDWQGRYGAQFPVAQQAFMQLLEQPSTYFEGSGLTGGQVYRMAAREVKQGSQLGERIKNIARTSGQDVDVMSPDQAVSLALRQLGARGVRYPGKPGQKYVVFTGEDVKPRAPLASRKPYRTEPKPGEDPAEFERYKKLGLQGKKTLWQKINNLRLKVIVETMDSMTARGYEGLFDGLIALKEYEKKAGVGIGIGDYENSAYVSARLATGVADMMTHILHYGPLRWYQGVGSHAGEWTDADGNQHRFRGLLEVLEELGPEQINDWLMWMGANRAKQLMAEGRERNLSEADIAAGLAKAEGREELFTRIKDEYAAMNKAQLDFAQEAGLIDAVKRAEWESEWYVPFYRLSEDEIEAPRLKRGLSHQEAGIRRLFGAEIPTADLLENVITNWLKLTDASVKNHALRLMVDNFKGKELDSGQEYITSETMRFAKVLVPRSEIRKRLMQDRSFAMQVARFLGMEETANNLEIINEVNKIPAQGFEQLWAITAPKDKDIVRVKRNGKNEYWRINIPGVLRATGHMEPRDWQGSGGMRAGRWFKRLLTTGVTLSPDFMLRNFIRDAAHAWAINPDNMFFAVDSFKGLKKALDEDSIYQAMMASGASFQGGYVHGTDPEASTQIIRRHLEKKGLTDAAIHAHLGSIVNTPEKLKSTVLELWQNYREIGDKVENANRIATMQKALDAGKSLAQALFESKDLMDYSRRGNLGAVIFMTDLLPFLNARMQGVDKLGRATGQHKKIIAMKVGKIVAFSVVLAMLNDDEERYKELPDWEKDAYWHIFPADQHIRIPKPFEIGIFAGTIPERMYRTWVTQSQPSEKLLWSLRHNLMETLNINYGIPQFALPAIEIAMNRSLYFDQPIESLSDRRLLPKERHNAFTSNTAMELGDTALAEWLRLSPKQIQHIWNGYTGTMGAYALKLTDMLVRGASDEHPSREAIMPHDVPIVRAIYQGQRVKGTQWATDFYDRMKEVRELHGTMINYVKQGNLDKARAFRVEHKEKLKLRRRMEGAQRMFSQLRKKRDKIMRSKDLTAQQKYQQMQAVQMRINALAKKIEGQTRSAFAG